MTRPTSGWAALARRPATSLAAACTVLAALAGGSLLTGRTAAGAPGTGPAATTARPLVPVARATVACPDPTAAGDSRTSVGAAAPGLLGAAAARRGAAGASPAGTATLAGLAPGGTRVALDRPGSVVAPATARGGPLVGQATGGLAPGFAAALVTRTPGGDLHGLSGTSCGTSDTDFWFVGSGAAVGQRGRLYLTNPEAAPAVVDVTLHGPDGPLAAPLARGLTVAARGQRVVLLDALAPATARFGVHVRAQQGRVVAALRDAQVRGLEPLGTDWVPAAAAPARRVVVPGLPAGPGERRLQVLVPGDADAIVTVRLLADGGGFAPAGADVVQVRAGAVAEVDLAAAAAGADVAVELTSDVPVTAGLLARTAPGRGELPELAWTAAAPRLTHDRPGVLAQASGGGAARSRLTLAAPAAAATVDLVPLPPAGAQVVVDAARLRLGAGGAVAVVPVAGSGPVVAARILTEAGPRGALLTVSPVYPGRYAVPVPSARADLSTGLRAAGVQSASGP
jgi:hypothetical protein